MAWVGGQGWWPGLEGGSPKPRGSLRSVQSRPPTSRMLFDHSLLPFSGQKRQTKMFNVENRLYASGRNKLTEPNLSLRREPIRREEFG